MKFKRTTFIEKGVLDIAPLIDVIFLLLLFFMLTSSFVFQPGIRVSLPRAVTSEALHNELLIVTVTDQSKVFVNERPVTDEELSYRISVAAKEGQSILIKADKNASMGKIIGIWDQCRKNSMKQISIATTQ
jgi:biopolymer transport protein ExbD